MRLGEQNIENAPLRGLDGGVAGWPVLHAAILNLPADAVSRNPTGDFRYGA